MCGLCGSFTQQGTVLSKRDRQVRARALEGLIIANQVRGTDSAGVAAIGYDGDYSVLKVAEEPARFVNRDEAQKILRTDAPLMIGHTRMTSMGNDVRDENAHPFVEGHVIGAHNGIINNYMQLDKTVRVDSQAVFRLLDQNPDTYDYALSQVSGSCALTWWDGRDPEAMFLVAHQNPLAAAIVPRINTVFWSSVIDHLETVMRTAYGTAVQFMDIKKDTVYRLDALNIYEWAEQKVSFKDYSHYNSNIRVYDSGRFGWDDEDNPEAAWLESMGMSGSPKATKATPAGVQPDTMSAEEEERYEEYWNRLVAKASASVRKNDDENESDSEQQPSVQRLHDMTDSEFLSANRFEIDDVDGTLECGYCDNSLGDKGVWDDGLQMMLCRFCQRWWDDFGNKYALEKGTSPITQKSMLPAVITVESPS